MRNRPLPGHGRPARRKRRASEDRGRFQRAVRHHQGAPGAAAAQAALEAALAHKAPDREYERRLDGAQEARLLALACSAPPTGRERWSLRLLAERLVRLEVVAAVSHETVRQVLKQTR